MDRKSTVGIVDYVVFGLMFLFSAVVGFYYAFKDRKNNSIDSFHLGNRKNHPLPVSMSLSVSIISAHMIVGYPAEVYTYGTMIFWQLIGMLVAVLLSTYFFLAVLYNTNKISIFEYIQRRFGLTMRYVSAILYVLKIFTVMGFALYAPCLSFEAITGSSLWITMCITAFVCTLYTLLGGMKAVVWTDSLQFLIIVAGLLSVVIIGSNKVGGLGQAWKITYDYGRIEFDNFSANPTTRHSVWCLVIGYGLLWTYANGLNQATVQRTFSLPNLRQARMAVLLSYPGMFLITSLIMTSAVVMVAYYHDCDPLKNGRINNSNQLFPILVVDTLGDIPGITGLVLACLFSGALSTISSALSGVSAVFVEDLAKPLWPRPLSEKAQVRLSRLFVLFVGLIMFALASGISQLNGLILQNITSAASSFAGPALGMYISGMVFPWTNRHGALVGLIISTVMVLWLIIGKAVVQLPPAPSLPVDISGCPAVNDSVTSNFQTNSTILFTTSTIAFKLSSHVRAETALDPFYSISYQWYTGFGLINSMFVTLIVSFLTGPTKPEEVDGRLMYPLFYKLCPFLPEKYRDMLKFGVKYDSSVEEPIKTLDNKEMSHLIGTFKYFKNNGVNASNMSDYSENGVKINNITLNNI